ncbi:MAG TPA: cupin domain-containing protein [Methylomirabilota bacterium]
MLRQGACRLIGPMAPTARRNGRPGVPKPWGWEMLWTLTPRYAGKILYIRRGQQISLQYHREKEESFFVRSGRLIFVLEDRRGDLRELWLEAGDSQHVPAGRLHRVIALEDSEVLEVSTPEIDDVERVDDLHLRRPDPGLHSSAY